MTQDNGRMIGVLFAVLQAIFYSTLGIFGKLLNEMGFDSSQIMIIRFVATTVMLGIFMIIWRKEKLISRDKAVYVQAIFFFLAAWFYFLAVEYLASAGMTTVIFYLFPVVVAITNVTLFKEKFSWITALALILAVGGTFCASGVFIPGAITLNPLGVLFGILSCITFATYSILIQRAGRSESSWTVTFTLAWTSALAAVIVFSPSIPALVTNSTWQAWALGAIMALLCTILPIILYIIAIKRIGGTMASLISISETPFSLFFAFLILGEILTPWQAIGAVLIVAGVLLVTAQPTLEKLKKSS